MQPPVRAQIRVRGAAPVAGGSIARPPAPHRSAQIVPSHLTKTWSTEVGAGAAQPGVAASNARVSSTSIVRLFISRPPPPPSGGDNATLLRAGALNPRACLHVPAVSMPEPVPFFVELGE